MACAPRGREVFDPHSAAAAARVVREACERIVALLDEAGLDAPALPEVGEQLQLGRDTMTRACASFPSTAQSLRSSATLPCPLLPRPMRVSSSPAAH